jgi:hypothetical protein
MTDDFWNNRWHWCVLAAGFLAASEGRLDDSLYVKELAYFFFEDGAFRDRVKTKPQSSGAIACATPSRSITAPGWAEETSGQESLAADL